MLCDGCSAAQHGVDDVRLDERVVMIQHLDHDAREITDERPTPTERPPAETDRQPNGYDLVSFALQLVQVCPIIGAVLGIFTDDAFLLRLCTGAVLAASWILAARLTDFRHPSHSASRCRRHRRN